MRILIPILFFAITLHGATALPSMTPPQKAIYTGICQEVLAPCCWSQTLTGHQSGAAEEVRARIAAEVIAGRTPAQIREGLVKTYGERILAFKSADQQAFVLFAVPAIVLFAGIALLAFYLLRIRQRRPALAAPDAPAVTLDDDWD